MTRKLLIVLAVAVTVVAFGAPAKADTYNFGCITNTSAVNCATGQAQLTVVVTAVGTNQVSFVFMNSGPNASSITDIYFDDGSLLGIASVVNSAGTVFSQGASPGNLPGGSSISPAFVATAGFTADSNPPTQPNGVNPGEMVEIIFNLQSGQTFADAIAELNDGTLRIGIHVQGFVNGGSESFVNTPPTVIPEPGTLALFGTGLVGLAGLIRRRISL